MQSILAQDNERVLSTSMFHSHQRLFLAPVDGWLFRQGNDASWANENIDLTGWKKFNPTELNANMEDETGRVEGWFRLKIKLDNSFKDIPLSISRDLWAATDIYVNGELFHSFGDTGNPYKAYNPILKYPESITLAPGKEYLIAIHFVDYETTFTQREIRLQPRNLQNIVCLTGPDYVKRVTEDYKWTHIYGTLSISISFLLFFLFWLLVFLNPGQRIFQLIAWVTSFTLIAAVAGFFNTFFEISYPLEKLRYLVTITFQPISTLFGLLILEWVLTKKISKLGKIIFACVMITNPFAHLFSISIPFGISFTAMLGYVVYLLYVHRKNIHGALWAVVAATLAPTIAAFIYINIHKYSLDIFYEYEKPMSSLLTLSGPLFLLIYISIRFKEILKDVSDEAQKVLNITEEKKEILANQNILLEQQVTERTSELKTSLENLKSTQSQLIQSEKMASLGELTAGIAHEIQNPLNFVNNFSEVSAELVDEMNEEIEQGNMEDVKEIAVDIKQNLEKINHHGNRAGEIVKGMLQHSRTSSGKKEATDINSLTDEYLRLAYHGLRAKDKSFNATLKTDFDEKIGKIDIIPQDIGRVILNLITNAFYAVNEKKKQAPEDYEPTVKVSTRKKGPEIQINVEDNGMGIPSEIKDKLFQPFFTTKPTGQGTGLGLSLSYDIIKAHGGEIKVKSKEGAGTEFIIKLPV